MTSAELRAARQLLDMGQYELAERSGVSIATIRRFEQGRVIGHDFVTAMRRAVEDRGVIIVPRGAKVAGRHVDGGVVRLEKKAAEPDPAEKAPPTS